MSSLTVLETLFLGYFLLQTAQLLVSQVRAYFAMRRHQDGLLTDELEGLFGTTHYKPISLLCPVFNEAAGVVASVNSLLALRYPETQVIVVNDGSTDATLDLLVQAFRLRPSHRVLREAIPTARVRGVYESLYVPNLIVVDKENGGKADALNCGLNLARFPLVCCMDGDSLLENDALLRVVRPFLDQPHVVACAGVIRPLNGCRVTPMGIRGIFLPSSWLARFQVMEYFRAFLYGRLGMSSFGMLFVVSGAFGVFRRDLLLEIGGFRTDTVGEDFEAVVRLHLHLRRQRRPYRIVMIPDPVCWTEVPERVSSLRRQRNRWQRGLLETMWRYRGMVLRRPRERIGMVSLLHFLILEALAPLIELGGYLLVAGYLVRGQVNGPFVLLFIQVSLFLGFLNSVVAILLEVQAGHHYQGLGNFLRLLAIAVLENFGYRQMTLLWRLQGTWDFLRGKGHWGTMTRKGISMQG